jgi:hypothetical protein
MHGVRGLQTVCQSSSGTPNNENMQLKQPGRVISLERPSIEWHLIQPSQEVSVETRT